MKATTMNTPQADVLSPEILSRNTVNVYKAIREQFKAITSETPHFTDYREQNLLNPNMFPLILRKYC